MEPSILPDKRRDKRSFIYGITVAAAGMIAAAFFYFTAEGRLDIAARPVGARVFLDDVDRGTTPLKMTLRRGEHRLEIAAEGYLPLKQKVFVLPRKTVSIQAQLVQTEATVR